MEPPAYAPTIPSDHRVTPPNPDIFTIPDHAGPSPSPLAGWLIGDSYALYLPALTVLRRSDTTTEFSHWLLVCGGEPAALAMPVSTTAELLLNTLTSCAREHSVTNDEVFQEVCRRLTPRPTLAELETQRVAMVLENRVDLDKLSVEELHSLLSEVELAYSYEHCQAYLQLFDRLEPLMENSWDWTPEPSRRQRITDFFSIMVRYLLSSGKEYDENELASLREQLKPRIELYGNRLRRPESYGRGF